MKCHQIIPQNFKIELNFHRCKAELQIKNKKSVNISKYYFKLNEFILLYSSLVIIGNWFLFSIPISQHLQ